MMSLPGSYAERIIQSLIYQRCLHPCSMCKQGNSPVSCCGMPVPWGGTAHGSDGRGDVCLEEWSQFHVVIMPMFLQTPRMISI